MAFQFLCPQGHLLQGDELQVGRPCQCPYCGGVFLVPRVNPDPWVDLATMGRHGWGNATAKVPEDLIEGSEMGQNRGQCSQETIGENSSGVKGEVMGDPPGPEGFGGEIEAAPTLGGDLAITIAFPVRPVNENWPKEG